MKITNSKYIHIYVFIFLCILVVLFKYFCLNTPFYLDEPNYVGSAANFLGLKNFRDSLGHPALFEAFAFMWGKVFGFTPFSLHSFVLIFAILGLWFCYLIGNTIGGVITGGCSALLLFFTPIYYTQSSMFLPDLPATTVCLVVVYSFLKKHWKIFYLFSALALLMRESSLGIILPFVLFSFFQLRNEVSWLKRVMSSLFVFLPMLSFFFLQYMTAGTFMVAKAAEDLNLNWKVVLHNSVMQVEWVFVNQGRWIFTLGALGFFYYLKRKNQNFKIPNWFWPSVISVFTFLAFFSFHTGWLKRYYLPVFAFPILLFCLLITHLIGDKLKRLSGVIISIVIIQLFFSYRATVCEETGWFRCEGTFDHNMQYADIIAVEKETIEWLKTTHPNKKILTAYPLNFMMAQSGLVLSTTDYELVVYTDNNNHFDNIKIKQELEAHPHLLMKQFEKRKKIVRVFEVISLF